MKTNEGMVDRGIRVILGIALIAFAIPVGFPESGWNWIGWIGIVPLLTGLIGWCPIYSAMGVSTCPSKAAR